MFGRMPALVGPLIALLVMIATLPHAPDAFAADTAPARLDRVALVKIAPSRPNQTPLVTKVGACPKGKGVCEGSGQMWCCPSYPNYPYCSCGNFPGSCSGTCY